MTLTAGGNNILIWLRKINIDIYNDLTKGFPTAAAGSSDAAILWL